MNAGLEEGADELSFNNVTFHRSHHFGYSRVKRKDLDLAEPRILKIKLQSEVPKRRIAVVDGSNVAFYGRTKGKERALLKHISLVVDELEKAGYVPKVFADRSLPYDIDDGEELGRLVKTRKVMLSPEPDADRFMLMFARENNALVVPNDTFEEYGREFPWVRDPSRHITYMIIGGRAFLNLSEYGEPGTKPVPIPAVANEAGVPVFVLRPRISARKAAKKVSLTAPQFVGGEVY